MTDWTPSSKVLWAAKDSETFEVAGDCSPEIADLPSRVDLDPDTVDRGLTKLVLSIVDLIRQLLERQALRRVDSGRLNDAEIERLGETLMRLDERMQELKAAFGLTDSDLRLNLGSLQDLDAPSASE